MTTQEMIEKILKQLKNEGVFLNLVRKAASEMEQDGLMEDLRTEGKQRSDEIFKKYFPLGETVDMTKELKDKIMRETKEYATNPLIGERISRRLTERITFEWISSFTGAIVEDKIREDMGLPPIKRQKIEPEEEEETDENANNGSQGYSEDESTQEDSFDDGNQTGKSLKYPRSETASMEGEEEPIEEGDDVQEEINENREQI